MVTTSSFNLSQQGYTEQRAPGYEMKKLEVGGRMVRYSDGRRVGSSRIE